VGSVARSTSGWKKLAVERWKAVRPSHVLTCDTTTPKAVQPHVTYNSVPNKPVAGPRRSNPWFGAIDSVNLGTLLAPDFLRLSGDFMLPFLLPKQQES
jgi:hypothetical protein